MLLRLLCSSQHMPRKCPQNRGFDSVMFYLWLLNQRGIPTEIVDTTVISEEDRKEAYKEAEFPSIAKKHKIRELFGTKRRSALYFGKGVPALLVYEEDDIIGYPIDIYPHRTKQGDSSDRFDVKISEYLRYLLGQRTGKLILDYKNEPLTLTEQRRLKRRAQW